MSDYFEGWAEKNGSGYENDIEALQAMYRKADSGFSKRFENEKGDDEAIKSSLKKYFGDSLEEIEARWDDKQNLDDEILRKMVYLTKGNILLRQGQYMGEHFFDPLKCYQQACLILEQVYAPEEDGFLDLMIQLNLGRYFRNMGKHNQRSDYWRALDEFKEIERKIERRVRKEGKDELSLWETHIWLEAKVNIGRAERYLYHLKDAKKCFLGMIKILVTKLGKRIEINPPLNNYLYNTQNEDQFQTESSPIELKLAKNAEGLYKDYLDQALLQLSIAYQKSRDYDMAQDICRAFMDEEERENKKEEDRNIDVQNNYGVCLWKMKSDVKRANEKEDYELIFDKLAGMGNRFACIYRIKCMIHRGDKDEKTAEEIEKLLKFNRDDQEVRLLKGLFWQNQGRFEESDAILKRLYEENPHISKGTIGLKAYYNIAENLLRQGDYYNAKKYYEKIEEECRKIDYKEPDASGADPEWEKELKLKDLPRGDLLAEIDKGWCLMNLRDYKKAKECYEGILKSYGKLDSNEKIDSDEKSEGQKDSCDRLGTKNTMVIYNNLGECYLHLIQDLDKDEELLKKAWDILRYVNSKEPNNSTTNRHLGYYHYKRMCLEKSEGYSESKKALKHFRKAEIYQKNYDIEDVYINAGCVSAAVSPLLDEKGYGLKEDQKKELVQSIENRLRYSSGIYSIIACAKLSAFLKILEKEYDDKKKENAEEKLKTMYRSLARIRLYEKEKGYKQFEQFMRNDIFRKLEATKRGELLICLFQLYEQIIEIKDICRFGKDAGQTDTGFSVPTHYTKISTLKKLLPKDQNNPGKLRLWNTIYMNDPYEGECFIEMMEGVAEKMETSKESQRGETVSSKIKKYFPYYIQNSDRKLSAEEISSQSNVDPENLLTPINENIYVISFSQQKNAIHMWIPYADDAKGCAVTFTEEFFDIHKEKDILTDVSSYLDEASPLYMVQYLDENEWDKWKAGDENSIYGNPAEDRGQEEGESKNTKINEILKAMEKIWEILDDLENRMAGEGVLGLKWNSDTQGMEAKKLIRNFVAGCLNEVRFLVKASEYSYENEVRMIHHSYEPKIDEENFEVPRLYIEVDRDIQIEEIKLGPKVGESQANEIVTWLSKTKRVANITKSGRHYK